MALWWEEQRTVVGGVDMRDPFTWKNTCLAYYTALSLASFLHFDVVLIAACGIRGLFKGVHFFFVMLQITIACAYLSRHLIVLCLAEVGENLFNLSAVLLNFDEKTFDRLGGLTCRRCDWTMSRARNSVSQQNIRAFKQMQKKNSMREPRTSAPSCGDKQQNCVPVS